MSNVILIEAGEFETRVAVMEEGRLAEVHLERHTESGVVGNIYKGRVSKVIPGIQAAFVDIGLHRDAFLFAGDLSRPAPAEKEGQEGDAGRRTNHRPIAGEVEEGQELLVQVVKEPLPGKGVRISSQISLPGRFVVLLPGASGVGISRRIADPLERQRLEAQLQENLPDHSGVIVRTAGAERSIEELVKDLEPLVRTWQELQSHAAGTEPPVLIHQEADLVRRTARDLLNRELTELWVEGVSAHEEIERYLEEVDPSMVGRLRLQEGDELLFDRFGVDDAIARAMRSRAWLASGGFIVINPTEALVAIDVNSGRNTGEDELEVTALQTNLEAAVEIARQIRLRDLGGIIVVDFIDMVEQENRTELVATFEAALSGDRARTQVSQVFDFGLVAVTRKRTRGGLAQRLTEPCPCCSGEGRLKDPMAMALELDREVKRRLAELAGKSLTVRTHPRLVEALEGEHEALLHSIRKRTGGHVELEADDELRIEEFEIRAR